MRVELACGCEAEVDHDSGDRQVVCGGGGRYMQDLGQGVLIKQECEGGRAYVVTAHAKRTINYTARAMRPAGYQEEETE